jgi:type III pantothenate kinase
VENRYEDPREVGRDRLVNAAAGHERAGGAVIVADLGSAVTVDAVSPEGAFLGGTIAPGLEALARGLAAIAPALPPWDRQRPEAGMPRSTRDAIRRGVVSGLAGLTERLVAEIEAAAGLGPLPLILTGGDAALVAPALGRPSETLPHLTLEGVRILYHRARRA